ncbi:MAG: MmgE/PrpD family protein [Alphaproteobacteria bacterium]|jgi:2-methylcitrate dehydratase PrpD|nr:MmgE/PrpD family protein [Alphaproteobacteria bacterium]
MSQLHTKETQHTDITRILAENSMGVAFDALPKDVVERAKHCLIDWLGVTLAGSIEPLAQILIEQAMAEGGGEHATIVGDGRKTSLGQAALINGSASHALDFDDVQSNMHGHPSVPVFPAVLAIAEKDGLAGKDVLAAVVAGFEAECRIGAYMGDSHYERGWHSTATVGTFGAAAGAARAMGLDAETCAIAFGIAATQAAGLKSMFGTMCKPLHAGKAAQNGLFAAQLAGRGFTSREDALERHQGLAFTQSDDAAVEEALEGIGERYEIADTLFKYHAACYGTHASIEAALKIRAAHDIDPDAIERVDVAVDARNMNVCGIPEPKTGLEGKFSLRYTTALALGGEKTAAIASYVDDKVNDPAMVALYEKITVVPKEDMGKKISEVTVHLADGVVLRELAEVWRPEEDSDRQWRRLSEKFDSLASPLIGEAGSREVIDIVGGFEDAADPSRLMELCGKTG